MTHSDVLFHCPCLFSTEQSAEQVAQCPADAVRTGFNAPADGIQKLDGRVAVLAFQYFQGYLLQIS